jgi:FAD/FMN-containing dehydrogenase
MLRLTAPYTCYIMLQACCPFYMLVELSGSNAAHDGEKLDAYLEATMGAGVVADGTVARDSTQTAALWAIREGITGALALP